MNPKDSQTDPVIKEARGQMVNHYHQLAVIEHLKKQSAMLTSQVTILYNLLYKRANQRALIHVTSLNHV